jgi:hypothetical protein
MVRCHFATASSFVAKTSGRSLRTFSRSLVKRHNSIRNWLFGLPSELFPLMWNKIISMLLTLLSTCLAFLRSALKRACHSNTPVRLMLSSLNACLIIASYSVALFPRFAQNFCTSLSNPVRNRIKTNTRLQIKRQNINTSIQLRETLYTDSQKMLVLIIYRCIALLKLLYRWQHPPRTLWKRSRECGARTATSMVGSPNICHGYMVMNPAGLGPDEDCAAEAHINKSATV